MWGSIKYNLANLTNPNGRDARQTFWYYVAAVVVAQMLVGILLVIPMMVSLMGDFFSAIANGADPATVNSAMMVNMGGMMGSQIWISAGTSLIGMLLLVCAFIRRLHDSDHSGYWAIAAVVANLAGIANGIVMIDQMEAYFQSLSDPANLGNFEAIMAQQQDMMLTGLVGWIAPIIVIIFGVMKSTDGPNQYGEAPVRF